MRISLQCKLVLLFTVSYQTVCCHAGATPPLWDPVLSPDLILGNTNCQLDGFDMTGGWHLQCIYDGSFIYLLLILLRKRKKDVGSVGRVAQSEKSTEKSQ